LTAIHIPTEQEEAARDLLRCREGIRADLLRARRRRKENPRDFYAIDDSGLELALLERGSSRRIIVMRFRPANIRVIHRRCRSADQMTGSQRPSYFQQRPTPGSADKPGVGLRVGIEQKREPAIDEPADLTQVFSY
jgi:hypothetical protein